MVRIRPNPQIFEDLIAAYRMRRKSLGQSPIIQKPKQLV